MARILKPPAPRALHDGARSLFLAGSIEMGEAEPWQAEVERAFADEGDAGRPPSRAGRHSISLGLAATIRIGARDGGASGDRDRIGSIPRPVYHDP